MSQRIGRKRISTAVLAHGKTTGDNTVSLDLWDIIDERLVGLHILAVDPCCVDYVENFTAGEDLFTVNIPLLQEHNTITENEASATLTAAQVVTGYIATTSGAATTLTLPTGTLLGAALGAVQGTVFDLYIDNTAGANTVTVAVGVNMIQSAWGVQEDAALAPLAVVSGVSGLACFRIMFSSATAAVFTRIA